MENYTTFAMLNHHSPTVIYTYKGGMKAVVWTELLQAGIYISGGLAAVVILGHLVPGGWSAIWGAASAAGKTKGIDTYPGLDRPHTIWAGLIGGGLLSPAVPLPPPP